MGKETETLHMDGGLVAKVFNDPDCEQPFDGQEGVQLVVLHRRYSDPAKGSCGSTPEEVARWERQNPSWFTIPLWLYDHSGVSYAAARQNPFHCQWDSGQVGIVALRRDVWGDGTLSDEELAKHAHEVATIYGQWANGECYSFVLEDEDGNHLDSCSGYVGMDAVAEAAKDAAASRSAPAMAA